MNRRFEIDPTLVAAALNEGRKLLVEIDDRRRRIKVTLSEASPYTKRAKDAANA